MNPLLDLAARPIIAHRGASGSAPENTMAAFALAIEQGADAIELDVRLTADGVPVVLHDAALDRTTDRSGLLREHTLAELGAVDAGARFTQDRGRTYPFKEADVRIPALTDVLRAFPEVPVLVEIKEVAAQDAVRQVLLEEKAVERCVLASELHAALGVFREPPFATAASGAEIGALYRAVLFRRVPARVPYRCLSVPLRHRGLPVPTRGFVAAARRLGCPVHVWTVNEPATGRLVWSRGVAGLVTNYPDLIRSIC
ncbi:MAG TPA: glycerophosphodiester phosphodiesterase [Gemmatimonadales bacterium]|nr:glycerophosphodiester phosphodiesterase [Gemmatimonadales bacterium]